MSLLEQMAASSREREEALLRTHDLVRLREECQQMGPVAPLRLGAFDLIAECKLRAPSAGRLGAQGLGPRDIAQRAQRYDEAGAVAISVLTEPLRFDGHMDHLRAAASRCNAPVMRKDFLTGSGQVYEARHGGAGGVLLITRMLDDEGLDRLLRACEELGMFALIECFDVEDCRRTSALIAGRDQSLLVGINTRDLATLDVVPSRLEALAPHLPDDVPWVAESGMHTPQDVSAAAALGYRLALVGTALMQASDPAILAAEMIAAGVARCG